MGKRKIDIQRNSLLCVKSIMTIALTVMLCVMVYRQPETYSETFRNCIIMVVTFYFAHQTEKRGDNDDSSSGVRGATLQDGKNQLRGVHGALQETGSGIRTDNETSESEEDKGGKEK